MGWDVMNLEELRPGAVALPFGPASPCSVCPVIELRGSIEKWEASLDKTHRRNVRHARTHGAFRYELSSNTARFDKFVQLHELSWRDRNQEGVLNTPRLRAFYHEAAESLAAGGCLRMHVLEHESCVVGAIFGMSYKNRGYAYLGGFDPGLRKSSPGTVLMWHAITGAISDGLLEWDLLRGEEQYKYLWSPTNRENVQIRITSS
jgi:CelD/BcsL family acetyltransferase involved in cellulose biosynthesis